MRETLIVAVAANVITAVVCAVLASTGGETTGREALAMAATGLLGIGAIAVSCVRAARR